MKKPVKKTGRIWRKPGAVRTQIVAGVCKRLRSSYGVPRLGNPRDPLDDLVYIVVSNKTSPQMARLTYSRLKASFDSWDEAIRAGGGLLRSILRPAGLSRVKAGQLRAAFRKIRKDFGRCDLRALRQEGVPDIHAYLVGLPGVSDKVAKCVMMYTMGARVLPVDAHLHRIATRLGWTARKRADQCHEELECLVPPDRRYALHVDCVLHGREICRSDNPRCEKCCINRYCEYFMRQYGKA
jgi:endonuclease III